MLIIIPLELGSISSPISSHLISKIAIDTWRECFREHLFFTEIGSFRNLHAVPRSWLNWLGAGAAPRAAGAGAISVCLTLLDSIQMHSNCLIYFLSYSFALISLSSPGR